MILAIPPIPGTVIRYSFLWERRAKQGYEEGEKDRPVVLLVSRVWDKGACVVVPITHRQPPDPTIAVEIPQAERLRLGLDAERCWVVLTEFNEFTWPGPDLRPVPDKQPGSVIYGTLSRTTYGKVLSGVQALLRAQRVRRVQRD